MEKMWRSMEVSWRFCVHLMEKLWRFDGSFMEKILDWDMKKLWRLDTLENYRLENTKDAIQWSSTRTNRRDGKMFRKIADWANTESGKEALTGVIWGFVGIIAVRLFCFLVCLVTGYPIN